MPYLMALSGLFIKKGLELGDAAVKTRTLPNLLAAPSPWDLQKKVLKKLISKAQWTGFGQYYHFSKLLQAQNLAQAYKQTIPVFDYDKLFNEWWHGYHNWKPNQPPPENITWPGSVNYFALSSGTAGAPSKRIPITKAMMRAMQQANIRQFMNLTHFNLPNNFFEKQILVLGGCTKLPTHLYYKEGDLSGILASQVPFWIGNFYKPGQRIASMPNWNERIDELARLAPNWDIGTICGVPSWVQLLMQAIIKRHNIGHIHQIWPNLHVLVHGGVSFEPYRSVFKQLTHHQLVTIDTYLSSEGFIAFQNQPNTTAMKMVLNNGIFFEFIPFNDTNFDANGTLKPNPQTQFINEVTEGIDYAIVMSTCAGAWRYTIGDTIRFTNVKNAEIIVTGRTKHFLSLCGEHLSVDNLSQAIVHTERQLNAVIPEFTVAGVPCGNSYAHQWYLGCQQPIDPNIAATYIDQYLKTINDDYAVERTSAIKEVRVQLLPINTFYEWMQMRGKLGGQHKFPRVLKGELLEGWQTFLLNKGYTNSKQ